MNTAATEAIAAQLPALVDINTVASEAEIPCRTATALQFIGAGGVFLSVSKTTMNIPNPRGGAPIELTTIDLKFNTANKLKPGAAIPGCNMDGVMYLPAKSVNVAQVAEPVYIRAGSDPLNPNAVTGVKLFATRADRTKPATLGIRVKFEEGPQNTPRRISGTIIFP